MPAAAVQEGSGVAHLGKILMGRRQNVSQSGCDAGARFPMSTNENSSPGGATSDPRLRIQRWRLIASRSLDFSAC